MMFIYEGMEGARQREKGSVQDGITLEGKIS
jgi:hypothetical protein